MIIEELKRIFEQQGEVIFKLYSLEYIIQCLNDKVVIYPLLYQNRRNTYSSIDELLDNYLIYNETILQNENRVILIKNNQNVNQVNEEV